MIIFLILMVIVLLIHLCSKRKKKAKSAGVSLIYLSNFCRTLEMPLITRDFFFFFLLGLQSMLFLMCRYNKFCKNNIFKFQ